MLNSFEFGPVVQEEMSLKDISYLEVWQPPCSVEQKHFCNFGRRHHEEKFCEIILNLHSEPLEMSFKYISYLKLL